MNKATAISPANIAFIKYWGQRDALLNLPFNSSISMNLSNCRTTTTIEFAKKYEKDYIELIDKDQKTHTFVNERVVKHIDKIRELGKTDLRAKVVTKNSFPSDAGIASSASGFSAVSLAGTTALGLKLSKKELSTLSRLGSGSASRSIPDGFVEWKKGESHETSYAKSLYSSHWWKLIDIVVVLSKERKKQSSLSGHKLALTSPYYEKRQNLLPTRLRKIKKALDKKDIKILGETIEEEAVDLHIIAMTSSPPVFYWNGHTIEIIKKTREWRKEGIISYFTIDAGPNLHIICEEEYEEALNKRLINVPGVLEIIVNSPSEGAYLTQQHLF